VKIWTLFAPPIPEIHSTCCRTGFGSVGFCPGSSSRNLEFKLPRGHISAGAAPSKGVGVRHAPSKLTVADRFKMARDTGFEVVQAFDHFRRTKSGGKSDKPPLPWISVSTR